MIEMCGNSIAVDTPSDLQRVRKIMMQLQARQTKNYLSLKSSATKELEFENV